MMTRRLSLGTVAGLMSIFLALGSLGLAGSALAQRPTRPEPTQTEIKARGKAAATKAHLKWDSLTPEQQEHLKATWKTDVEKAQAKWDGMTADQQQQFITKAKAGGKKVAEKWQSLPK